MLPNYVDSLLERAEWSGLVYGPEYGRTQVLEAAEGLESGAGRAWNRVVLWLAGGLAVAGAWAFLLR